MLLLAQESVEYSNSMPFQIDGDQGFVLIMVALGCLTAIVIVSVVMFTSFSSRREENRFKQELLDRGLSADEIETVIKATPPEGAAERYIDRRK